MPARLFEETSRKMPGDQGAFSRAGGSGTDRIPQRVRQGNDLERVSIRKEQPMESRNLALVTRWCSVWLMFVLVGCLLMGIPSASNAAVTIPELDQWKSRMLEFGQKYCAAMNAGTGTLSQKYTDTLFDAERVYYQIATYTSDPSWKLCANLAESIYRDVYIFSMTGSILPDQVFTFGLKMDYFRTDDENSQFAIIHLVSMSPYTSGRASGQSYVYSQEVAQALMAYVDMDNVGGGLHYLYEPYLTQALGHIDQWYVDRLWETSGSVPHQPLKVGMTLQALIQAQAHKADTRILPKVKLALDNLWTLAWRASDEAFYLSSDSPDRGDPSFNLLIAPAYAWYYTQTGETVYRDRADQIFAGGVKRASLATALQFNQNYMWSFDYVLWRQAGSEEPPAPEPGPGPGPDPAPAPAPPPPTTSGPPTCSAAKPSPESLWPPNHKMVTVDIRGVTDPNGDPVTLTVTGVKQDEPVSGQGDGDTSPDAMPLGSSAHLRAERSGMGDGRVYEVAFKAEGKGGGTCSGTVRVSVPKNKNEKATDSGQNFDSLKK